jgi:hypothetical protein
MELAMHPSLQPPFRAQIYCWDDAGYLSLTDPVDVFAADFDEAARKVTGGDVSERGPNHKLAAKVWKGRDIRLYYRN